MASRQERNVRKSIANTLGIDDSTVARLSTDFLLSAVNTVLIDRSGGDDSPREQIKRVSTVHLGLPKAHSRKSSRQLSIQSCSTSRVDEDACNASPTLVAPLCEDGGNDTSEGERAFVLGHVQQASDVDDDESSGSDDAINLSRRRSRLPSLFATKLGPELAGTFLGESVRESFANVKSFRERRTTLSEKHREAAGRRNLNFAHILMQHLQRQQAREDFGASKVVADEQEIQLSRQLRSSHWFAVMYLFVFQSQLRAKCTQERAKRMLIKTLAPLIIRSVFRRRKVVHMAAMLSSTMIKPAVVELMRASPILSKWPMEAVERVRDKLKAEAYVEGACVSYENDMPQQSAIVFVMSGHLVEVPNRADIARCAASVAPFTPLTPEGKAANSASPGTFQTDPKQWVAKDVLPLLFDSNCARQLPATRARSESCYAPSEGEVDKSHTASVDSKATSSGGYNLPLHQVKSLSTQAALLYQELDHCVSGGCFGDVQVILGQRRRRSLRAWVDTTCFSIAYEDMIEILNTIPSSSRADCLHTGKNIAKSQLAKQSKPSIGELRSAHFTLGGWPVPMLAQLQTALLPQVSVEGEVLSVDLLHSNKVFVMHSGCVQVEARLSAAGNSGSRVVRKAGPRAVLGWGGAVQSELPNTIGEQWALRSLVFSEMWVVPSGDVTRMLTHFKVVQQTVGAATEQVSSFYNSAITAVSGLQLSKLGTHSVLRSVAGALRSVQAIQSLHEKTLLRVAKVLRPLVTFPGEGLCVEKCHPREAYLIYTGSVTLQRVDPATGTCKTIRELQSGSTLCFTEVFVETVVEYSAICNGSCIVFHGGRQDLLDAISNGGRDFSTMYALIERCEVISGLKTAKAAEEALMKKTKELEALEKEVREKQLQEGRDRSAKWAKEFDEKRRIAQEELALQTPKRRPLNACAMERVENLRRAQLQFHQMTVENRVFASMGNQLYQYVKNPALQERLAYLSDPLRVLEPVYDTTRPEDRPSGRSATTDAGSSAARLPPRDESPTSENHFPRLSRTLLAKAEHASSMKREMATLASDGTLTLVDANADHAAPHPPRQQLRVSNRGANTYKALRLKADSQTLAEVLSSNESRANESTCEVVRESTCREYHPQSCFQRGAKIMSLIGVEHALGSTPQDADPHLTEASASPLGMVDTPRLSELAVLSTDLNDGRSREESSINWCPRRHQSPYDGDDVPAARTTVPTSLRQTSAPGSVMPMVRVKVDDDTAFFKSLRREYLPGPSEAPHPPELSASGQQRQNMIKEKLSLLDIGDFEGTRTKHMIAKSFTRAQHLAPPRPSLPLPQVQTARGRSGVATFGTTIQYVSDPFRAGRIHPNQGLKDDGTHRVARVVPRHFLHGSKDTLIDESDRALFVERALTIGNAPRVNTSTIEWDHA